VAETEGQLSQVGIDLGRADALISSGAHNYGKDVG
jgi:hypothetical protein